MIVIGVDPHKSTHTATAVDSGTNKDLGSLRISADLNSYRELIKWAGQWPERIWAVENASGLGHHLTQWLVSQAEAVVDVPATATARVRELSRGGRRKNDRIDAAAAACVAFSQGDFRPVGAEKHSDGLRVLDERRIDLVRHKGRLTNQLHALLRELLPGGLDRAFTTEEASDALRRLAPASGADAMRKEVGLAIVGDLRRLRFQIDDITTRIEVELKASGTSLLEIEGVGTVTACRILSRTGDPARFRDQSAFASYAGTAPIEVASADKQRHRGLPLEGDRSLNAAIYIVAVTQSRMAGSAGNAYYRRKLDEGKTSREAIRCLKRQIAKRLWRTMISDAGEAADGYCSVSAC
ncbi:Transposase IS116/IS110/IS902 family (plasmid) [Tsukamurella tyrosinosolvens]|uniref:IS110 family transposase n=4 Tax=Tsukamurellaceae TaxID=85028 RepID=A0A5C5RP70_9ACTN|nr:transposase [Tsukamurella pulmonis]KXO95707.1 transposase [Tsukamurella tyrosinosolvens]TWS24480.1 IS110 family transposase [Tsukamurella sputi]SDQ49935.1 Transposase [Tsukamurella pulmonis]SED55110.1 Transposase [Tsukamurella tyrosinosolvens]